MTRFFWFAGLALLTSCGEQAPAPNDRIEVTGQSAGASTGPALQEVQGQAFAASVLGSLDFSLASARLAAERGDGANTRALAQKMEATLGAARRELAGLTNAEPTPAPTHQSDLAILSSTRGAPLEKVFADQQMEALTLLVGTVRAYKNGGDNAELKVWAEKYQGAINEQLLNVQTLRAELEGEG